MKKLKNPGSYLRVLGRCGSTVMFQVDEIKYRYDAITLMEKPKQKPTCHLIPETKKWKAYVGI
jgi:hypothetical protein